jgi:hypothetical protein
MARSAAKDPIRMQQWKMNVCLCGSLQQPFMSKPISDNRPAAGPNVVPFRHARVLIYRSGFANSVAQTIAQQPVPAAGSVT